MKLQVKAKRVLKNYTKNMFYRKKKITFLTVCSDLLSADNNFGLQVSQSYSHFNMSGLMILSGLFTLIVLSYLKVSEKLILPKAGKLNMV